MEQNFYDHGKNKKRSGKNILKNLITLTSLFNYEILWLCRNRTGYVCKDAPLGFASGSPPQCDICGKS